ncbi:MAG: class I SAM-dependent rRNA methyltransferase [Deltaproteobacteria bacterium]|nr:class I SAM-dependent rRNA methyltransferase [Deltaproteobacteria bacterium]
MRTLAVPGFAAAFVAAGGRDIDISRVTDLALTPGEHVRVTDEGGDEIGLALGDPDNARLRVMAVPADGFAKVDGALIGWRVERALALRTLLGLPGSDHAYRIVHGAGDGLPGFACDVLGRTAVVYAYGDGLRTVGRQLAEAIVGFAKLDGAVIKLRARGGASDVKEDTVGVAPAETAIVTEHGVPYEVHPLGGLNTGLFTDMREQRRGLPRFVAGKRVLNLFSYTGALSVTCARAGAATVTSVDTSAGVNAWNAGNFGRSGFAAGDPRWKFETGDASRYLVRAARDKERYDVVLIDPPSTSSAAGVSWALGRDYPELIAKATAVIPPDGLLWLAANTHELGSLAKLAHKGLRQANRVGSVLEQSGLPPEYPTLVAQPADRYLQICLLRVA